MSSSLVSSLYGGQEAAFQEQMKRQFRENLARDPVAMQAYQKATGGNTPWYSPSALSASENERAAAIRRTNQMSRGAQAVRERAIAQGRDVSVSPEGQIQIGAPDPYKAIGKYRTLPSGLSVDQVENLPGGFKAVYDREGRLVGTNAPVQVPADAATKSPGQFMDALDKAAFNRGEGTAAEKAALYPAMEAAVRQARMAKPAAAPGASVLPVSSAAPAPTAEPTREGTLLPSIGLSSASAQGGLLPSIGLPVLEPGLTTAEWDTQMAKNREKGIENLTRTRSFIDGTFTDLLKDMQEQTQRAYERAPKGAGLSEDEMIRRSREYVASKAPLPESLAGTGFEEQINQFYAAPPPPADSDPFASRTTPGLENVLRKLLPITVGRSGQGEALAGQVLPRSEGKLASAFRLLTEWPGVSDADVAELANAFPDMDWTTKGLTAAEASRKFQRQLNELARSGRITAASDREVTPRVGPYSVQQEQFDYRLQTPEERVRTAFAR